MPLPSGVIFFQTSIGVSSEVDFEDLLVINCASFYCIWLVYLHMASVDAIAMFKSSTCGNMFREPFYLRGQHRQEAFSTDRHCAYSSRVGESTV